MKFIQKQHKLLAVVFALTLGVFVFPSRASATHTGGADDVPNTSTAENTEGGDPAANWEVIWAQYSLDSMASLANISPYPPAYPSGTFYNIYVTPASTNFALNLKPTKDGLQTGLDLTPDFALPVSRADVQKLINAIPNSLTMRKMIANNASRCDPNDVAMGYIVKDTIKLLNAILTGIPIASNISASTLAVVEYIVNQCDFQIANIDSAEIQAAYQNTIKIITKLNADLGGGSIDLSNLDVKVSTRASQDSVTRVQNTANSIDTSVERLAAFAGDTRPAHGVAASKGDPAFSCAMTAASGVKCWGFNLRGQLGNGTTTDSPTPVEVVNSSGTPLRGVVAVTAGLVHTCALTDAGGVKCWGQNGDGQLGIGGGGIKKNPVDVSGLTSGVLAVAAGERHTCALLETGGVKCWGRNDYGQLGNGPIGGLIRTPVDVVDALGEPIRDVVALAAGDNHTCAVDVWGTAKCWGYNEYGQLGNLGSANSGIPVDVREFTTVRLTHIANISLGRYHTCALITNATVKCWGRGNLGQLGRNSFTDSDYPEEVVDYTGDRLEGILAVDSGRNHTCAVDGFGNLYCWGWNSSGQLGNGSKTNQPYAFFVSPLLIKDITGVSAGMDHTCALTREGPAFCWGLNDRGQLGNGTTEGPELYPYPVSDLVGFPTLTLAELIGDRASQESLNLFQSQVNSNLDAKVSSRASKGDVNILQTALNNLQADVDNLDTSNLDVAVSTRASTQDLFTRASQASLDNLISLVALNLDVAVSTRASQTSVDAVNAAIAALNQAVTLVQTKLNSDLDVAVSTRASQSSVNVLHDAVAAVDAAIVVVQTKLNNDLDVAVSTRASQASLDEVRALVEAIDLSYLDVPVSSRASQESLDLLQVDVDVLNETTNRIENKVDDLGAQADSIETKVDNIQATLDHCETAIALVPSEPGGGGTDYGFYVHTTWHGDRVDPESLAVWVSGDQLAPEGYTTESVLPGVTHVLVSGMKWAALKDQPLTVEVAYSGSTCSAVEVIH